MYVNEIVHMI